MLLVLFDDYVELLDLVSTYKIKGYSSFLYQWNNQHNDLSSAFYFALFC